MNSLSDAAWRCWPASITPPARVPWGLELPSEEVLFFGHAAAGTPLLQGDPRVGLDLPLRMLVWQAAEGTRLAYHDPRELSLSYDLAGRAETLEKMDARLGRLAAAAAG